MNETVGQGYGAPITRAPSITPLTGDALLDAGTEFPRQEIHRRILSICWRDCCLPTCFSRAPAPVVEFGEPERQIGESRHRIAAWWLLCDGIVRDDEGPHSERLRPYLEGIGRSSLLWPRYEFFLGVTPGEASGDATLTAEIAIFPEAMVSSRQSFEFRANANGQLRVIARRFGRGR